METRTMRILTICPFVPHAFLPHAGGQYLYAHMTALQKRYQCEMVVPDTAENRAAAADGGMIFNPRFAAARGSGTTRREQATVLLRRFVRPVRPEPRFDRSILDLVRERIGDVDAVELQWPEYAGLVPDIRALAPHVPIVVVEHDVLSQRVARDRSAPSLRTRVRAGLTARRVAAAEKALLDRADCVLVFSAKDADLLRAGGVSSRVDVLLPPLEDERMWDERPTVEVATRAASRILFVAAFDRDVNDTAARWFIEEVFPQVRLSVPDATLVLAGARIRDELKALAQLTPGVEMTGFVEDLGAVYAGSDLAIVPLLAGAGLKFKVATAMMWGLPVVSTTVGAEGYPTDQGLFAGVTDDADQFAAHVVGALTRPDETAAIARTGRSWALSTFSNATFEDRLDTIYRTAAFGSRPERVT